MSAEKPQPVAWHLDEETARFLRDFIGDGDDIAAIRLWVGTTVDLDGKEWHGLNVSLADRPEEGSVQLVPCAPPQRSLSDADLDVHLDTILHAAGSALRHYTFEKSRIDMRSALRAAIAAAQEPPCA